ncbi:hypothetical protein [Actinoplanes sp. NPDC023714]|uniref:TRAFAC clade GTPase domain-containing protein n=1 Tax=Actinoplanes sp. NPDC023714 TaxID=3154322 RepID=UPI0034004433
MAATRRNTGQYTYYTYTPPVRDTDRYWRIGFWLIAFPFVVLAGTLVQAGRSLTAYTSGVAAGLGIGKEEQAQALSPPQPVHEWDEASKREPAYEQYLFGQAWRDVRNTADVALQRQRESFKAEGARIAKRHVHPPEDDVTDRRNAILGVAQFVALGAGTLVAAVLLLVAFVAQAVVLALLGAGAFALLYALRLVDSAVLYLRRISRSTCPACHERVPYPSYRCPGGCKTVQHDVRPGRYGMIHRTCRCGRRMTTLLMFGSHRMQAVCPHCGNDLDEGAMSTRELVLPVFGSPVAGKTQLLGGVALAAGSLLERAGGRAEPADDYSRTWMRTVTDLRRRGGNVTKTATASQHAISLRLGLNGGGVLLKMFDAAGETFQKSENIRDLKYFRSGGTLLFVLDPLSVPALWDGLEEERRRRLEPYRAVSAPEVIFQETVQTLHQINIDTRRIRLAVAVSKADLVAPEITEAHAGDDESIRAWLGGPLDQGNLVRAVKHEFPDARFFLTDATFGGGAVHPSIETLAAWILAGEGMRV